MNEQVGYIYLIRQTTMTSSAKVVGRSSVMTNALGTVLIVMGGNKLSARSTNTTPTLTIPCWNCPPVSI